MEDGSTTADSDDLEIVKVTRRPSPNDTRQHDKPSPQSRKRSWSTQSVTAVEQHGRETSAPNQDVKQEEECLKVEWSEDEPEISSKPVNRTNPLKRKRPGRKPKGTKVKAKKSDQFRRNGELAELDVDLQELTDSAASEDEDVNDVPEHIQKRRAKFDERTRTLKEGGLKLPPNYEDVDFSDDERLEDLAERPEFLNTNPTTDYKDKELPSSLGLIPASIAQWLRDYQVHGAAFLHKLFVYQQGGILGDDMGK